MDGLLKKINELTAGQVAWIMAAVGFVVFFTGLNGGFQGDDTFQIVTNVPVHSIANIGHFFSSSTFFNGEQLTGIYYRPLMTTTFSLVYSLFGANPVPYHIAQLALYVGGAFVLYLIFRHFFKPLPALALALIFLVHPINSQNVYAIPSMQEPLCFLFGTLAIWTLIRYRSVRSLFAVAGWLFAALLSKESAIVFILLAGLYLVLFDRERLQRFLGVMTIPVTLYILLKANAVGLFVANAKAAPIDSFSLPVRLLTTPSLIVFYVARFVFPNELANNYYWVYSHFSVQHVLLPLLGVLLIAGAFVYIGWLVKQRLSPHLFKAYVFFAAWSVLAIGLYLQILPLDMTACEGWFYVSMAGLLGAIGVAIQTVKWRVQPSLVAILLVVMLGVLGVRSAIRGTNFQSQYVLAMHDVQVSKEDYFAMNNLAQELLHRKQFQEAATYAQRSIDIYPAIGNYDNLGVAREQMADYQGAIQAYQKGLKYGDMAIVYENLSLLLLVHADPAEAQVFFMQALKAYPHDYKLWVYYALFQGAQGHNADAKTAIAEAAKYGTVPPYLYNNIMAEQPFVLPLQGKQVLIK